MDLIQQSSTCNVYKVGKAIIFTSTQEDFTVNKGIVECVDRALMGLAAREISKNNAVNNLRELTGCNYFAITPKSTGSDISKITNIISSYEGQ